tara:strand:+ start:3305 stop:3652 length:348 start_codon:yes stop_codon:yes gene_type:complete
MDIKFTDYPFIVRPLTEAEGGGFLISLPDLQGCMSDGATIEEALDNAKDAFNCWVQAVTASGKEMPKPHSADKELVHFITRLPKTLNAKLRQLADKQGISLNKLVQKIIEQKVYY